MFLSTPHKPGAEGVGDGWSSVTVKGPVVRENAALTQGGSRQKASDLSLSSCSQSPVRQVSLQLVEANQEGSLEMMLAGITLLRQGTEQAKREEWVLGGERTKPKISIILWFF